MYFYDYPIIRAESELPLFLLNMGQQYCQDHITRKDGYPCPQILYCTKGSGTLLLDGERHIISPYTAVFLPAGYPHEYFPNEDIWDIHWVVPSGFTVPKLLEHFGLVRPSIYSLRETNMLEHIFRKMHEALISDSIFGNYRASGYLYDFLIEFYRLTMAERQYSEPNTAVLKAVDYINSHYSSPITLDDLCAVSGVSRQHLCLLFRRALNSRPMEYISKRRIQAAKELITASDKTIEQIAQETGFCTGSYFCKIFKRYEGITTTQFKNGGAGLSAGKKQNS